MRAFELRLVKQIVVGSAAAQGGANDAFVRVEQIDYKKGISTDRQPVPDVLAYTSDSGDARDALLGSGRH